MNFGWTLVINGVKSFDLGSGYSLSWAHVGSGLCLPGYVSGWDFFLSFSLLACCLWCTPHSGLILIQHKTLFFLYYLCGKGSGLEEELVLNYVSRWQIYHPNANEWKMGLKWMDSLEFFVKTWHGGESRPWPITPLIFSFHCQGALGTPVETPFAYLTPTSTPILQPHKHLSLVTSQGWEGGHTLMLCICSEESRLGEESQIGHSRVPVPEMQSDIVSEASGWAYILGS